MKTLYCDCFSGISGDMFLAAMLDAGMPEDYLAGQLALLNLPEYRGINARKVLKGVLKATSLDFDLVEAGEPKEAITSEAHHNHESGSIAEMHHEHSSETAHHGHHHPHARNYDEIISLINKSGIKDSVKQAAVKIFTLLGEAEAEVHGTTIHEVHFHEVGAVDSILDIVGAAAALDYFSVNQIYTSAVPLGGGMIQTQHGLLPVPAPATLELLKKANARVTSSTVDQELVTPTGAAILAAFAKFEQPDMQMTNVGLGAGHRDLPWPNVLRLVFGECEAEEGTHVEIEANIDDMNPQFYDSVMKHLFAQGALDVFFSPIQMKKNRPATRISVIAAAKDQAALAKTLLRETSTLGVRIKSLTRQEASREAIPVETQYGRVTVKTKLLDGKIIQANPEYEDCLELAEKNNLLVAQVYREALIAAAHLING